MRLTRFMPLIDPWKWLLAGVLGLGLVACGSSDDDDDVPQATTTLRATMTGEQEAPLAVITGAVGTGTLTLAADNAISGNIVLNGMTATAAHIHTGDVGVAGPVIVTLVETTPGTWSVPANTRLTNEQAAALTAGGLYFNAHSAAHPDGEVRGQIGREVFVTPLLAAQEVPPVESDAIGIGVMTLDPATRKFTARLGVIGMDPTAAHIHTGAIGVSGPVTFPLTETPANSGTWVSAADATLTEAQLATLREGGLYFNAHSTAFPNGEVRGQIARQVRYASLSADQEVPTTSSTATGTGTLVVDPATRAATGSITLSGMTATAAHIHIGAQGVNGPVIVPLTNTSGNVWSVPANTQLTAEQFLAYKQGNLYYNAHSVAFPDGEIRGQIR